MFAYLALAVICLGSLIEGSNFTTPPPVEGCDANSDCNWWWPIYSEKFQCPPCPSFNWKFPHPSDCTKFCQCAPSGNPPGGLPYGLCEMDCPPWTKFDVATQGCISHWWPPCDPWTCDWAKDPCLNGGTCIGNVDDYITCECPDNCKGQFCEICDIECPEGKILRDGDTECTDNPCDPDPCWEQTQGAFCELINGGWDFECNCPTNCYGKLCQCLDPDPINNSVNPCASSPCQNYGSCESPLIDPFGFDCTDYFCYCPPGYYGKNCEIKGCEDACDGVYNGNRAHPDPDKCDYYCACPIQPGALSYEMPCPAGLYFNADPDKCYCDWPENVDCGWNGK